MAPASKVGLCGICPSQPTQPPFGELVIAKASAGVASFPSGALQGVRRVLVGKEPQVIGVVSGALGPPEKLNWKSSKGSWGLSLKVAVSWPVSRLGSTLPASFTTTPVWGSLTAT